MSRTRIPPPYKLITASEIPEVRRSPFGTSTGSNVPARSRGTDTATGPASVFSVLAVKPLRPLPLSPPCRCSSSSSASPACSIVSCRSPPHTEFLTLPQVQQQHEPGRALDQGADRRGVARAHDQVAFPVPGHRPVRDLGGPLADHHHVLDPAAPLAGLPAGPAQRPPRPQARRQLPAQRPPALHVDRLVDRLVRHPHLRLVRELRSQHHADLLRRPAPLQHRLNQLAQPLIPRQPRRLRPPRPCLRLRLRGQRPVAPLAAVAADLPAHRGRVPPQPRRDHPNRSPAATPTAISSR